MTTSTRTRAAVRPAAGVALAVGGTAALLVLTGIIGQQHEEAVWRYFVYQASALAVAALVVGGVYLLKRRDVPHLRWGQLGAAATPVRALGIGATDTWRSTGRTFAVLITLVTGAFLVAAYRDEMGAIPPSSWALAAVLALPLSASNALAEELVTRWAIVESLTGPAARYAPWVSAVVFGAVHYFGIPGGWVGALMAGFLAWLLARSIQDVRGIGWAWTIHFCQDVLIFTITLATFVG